MLEYSEVCDLVLEKTAARMVIGLGVRRGDRSDEEPRRWNKVI